VVADVDVHQINSVQVVKRCRAGAVASVRIFKMSLGTKIQLTRDRVIAQPAVHAFHGLALLLTLHHKTFQHLGFRRVLDEDAAAIPSPRWISPATTRVLPEREKYATRIREPERGVSLVLCVSASDSSGALANAAITVRRSGS
jgi:hypothetical protein